MRITFYFQSNDNIVLPKSYQNILYEFVYKYFNYDFDSYLTNNNLLIHSKGKPFKLFTFSMIETPKKVRYLKNINHLLFPREVSFTLSTVIDQIDIQLIEDKMKSDFIILGNNPVMLNEIKIHKPPNLSSKHIITMKSPLTIFSTLNNRNGKTHIYYYHPDDKSFCFMLEDNLIRKYKSFSGKIYSKDAIFVKPINYTLMKFKYENDIIEGYTGNYEIEGDEKLIKFAYDVGLGQRNAQGFGLFEIWR